jgi:hypothetical protein
MLATGVIGELACLGSTGAEPFTAFLVGTPWPIASTRVLVKDLAGKDESNGVVVAGTLR